MHKTTPNGEWSVKQGEVAAHVNSLFDLTDEQREHIFSYFCTHCGSTDRRCQCWNDE